ncbi:MAG: carbohydrate kinase family protein [bacterium]
MYDAITFGSATYDVFVRSSALEAEGNGTPETCLPLGSKVDVEEMDFDTGGGATNAAATFGRLGLRTAAVCAIGQDIQGREILRALRSDGVSPKFVQESTEDRTGCSIVIMSGSGERTILVHRGAGGSIDTDRIAWPKLKARWFYVTSLGGNLELAEMIINRAEAIGARVSWNPGNRELEAGLAELDRLLRRIDVLNLNREEAATLSELSAEALPEIVEKLRRLPKRALVVTDGTNGAYAAEGRKTWRCPALDVPRINTTGAGDAFGSGLVAGLIRHDEIRSALAVGILNSAGLVQHTGAKHGLLERFPSETEIRQVIVESWK